MKLSEDMFQVNGRIIMHSSPGGRTLIAGLVLDTIAPDTEDGWEMWNVDLTICVTKKWKMSDDSDLRGGRVDQVIREMNNENHWKPTGGNGKG